MEAGEPSDRLIVAAPAGERLDRVVAAALPALSRRQIRAIFDEGRVSVVEDGRERRARRGERSEGLTLAIRSDHGSDAALPDPSLEIAVVFESADFVIVDKPAGIPTAPVRPGERGTIANALLARYPEMASLGFRAREPGLCHRLDNGTSGLLLAARSAAAFECARAALADGRIDKRYLLVCRGEIADEGSIDLSLRSRGSRVKIDAAGRRALTHYRVLRRAPTGNLVEARAAGAFRHQLRVHFAAIGAPLIGDRIYGGAMVAGFERHALHASELRFAGHEALSGFEAHSPLPRELEALLT